MKEEIILAKAQDGKIHKGKVVFHDDWFEKWKNGENPALMEIMFDEGSEVEIVDSDVDSVIEKCQKEFEEKAGITWEEYQDMGCPEYKRLKVEKIRKKLEEGRAKTRGLRRTAGLLEDAPSVNFDFEVAEKQIEELKKKLEELSEKEKQNRKKYKFKNGEYIKVVEDENE